jgi:glycosyltransferase involved in cell wall biosynthesis
MSPTFSVIIPTYNQAEYLRIALKSVLDQTCPDFEVIIVNNYSTDHTLDVVDQINDQRFRVINFRNNGVIGAGRNTGIRESTGEYVAFLDSDDTWHRTKLERIAQTIVQDPDLGLICHDQTLFRNGRIVGRSHYGPPEAFQGDMYDYLLLGIDGPSTSATVVSRRYLDDVGGFSEDSQHITVEDYDLWLKLAQVCRFRFLRDILGTHVYHSSSASARIELHLCNTIAVLDKHFGEASRQERIYARSVIQRKYAYAYYGAARQYHKQRAFKKALGRYALALRTYPFHFRFYAGTALLLSGILPAMLRTGKATAAPNGLNAGESP